MKIIEKNNCNSACHHLLFEMDVAHAQATGSDVRGHLMVEKLRNITERVEKKARISCDVVVLCVVSGVDGVEKVRLKTRLQHFKQFWIVFFIDFFIIAIVSFFNIIIMIVKIVISAIKIINIMDISIMIEPHPVLKIIQKISPIGRVNSVVGGVGAMGG